MLSDDLIGRVALEPLRARVPVNNDPARVQHVDGVIDDAFDEDTEATLAFQQRIPCCDAFCDIAGNLGEAYEIAVLVHDLVEYCIAPETTAVLAYAPSLGLVPTSPARSLKDRPWDTFFLVLGREETREMLADDFRRRVALDLLGASVPACNEPLGVEHVDGVIRDSVKEQLKLVSVQETLRAVGGQWHPRISGSPGVLDEACYVVNDPYTSKVRPWA